MSGTAAAIGCRASLLVTAILGANPFVEAVVAQARPTTVPIDTVTGRARPEYDAIGIGLGGFTIYPDVAMNLAYDNNIYRTSSPKQADAFAQLRPTLRIESGSQRYPVSVEANATVRRYAKIETENSEQYSVSANAAAEIATGANASVSASYARLIEPRGSAGDLFIGGKPIRYDLAQAEISASRDIGRIGLEVGGDIARYNYAKVRAGGIDFDQDFRDYRETGAHARIAYSVSPAIAAFVRGSIGHSAYPRFDGDDRSSKGYSLLAGVQLGLTNLVNGSLGVGYLRENYADPIFGDVSGLDYDVALNWNPTPLLSVAVRGGRSLQRSPFVGSAGGIQTTLSGSAQYELLRQLILMPALNYTRVSYRGVERSDRFVEAQLGAQYLVNRTLGMTLSFNYRRQTSSGPGARDFDGFGGTIGVTLHR